MSETPTEPDPFPWVPLAETLTWLQLDEDSPLAGVADWCRQASAAYCEDQRADLAKVELVTVDTGGLVMVIEQRTFVATRSVVMAAQLGAARLYARRSTPAGLASFGEFGASEVLRLDPDVSRMLGTGRNAAPRVG